MLRQDNHGSHRHARGLSGPARVACGTRHKAGFAKPRSGGRNGLAARREKLTALPAAEKAATVARARDGPYRIEMPKQSATRAAPTA